MCTTLRQSRSYALLCLYTSQLHLHFKHSSFWELQHTYCSNTVVTLYLKLYLTVQHRLTRTRTLHLCHRLRDFCCQFCNPCEAIPRHLAPVATSRTAVHASSALTGCHGVLTQPLQLGLLWLHGHLPLLPLLHDQLMQLTQQAVVSQLKQEAEREC
jgi:hypothetical protein